MINYIQLFAAETSDLSGDVKSFSIRVVLIASLVLVVLLVIAALVVNSKRLHNFKTPLFVLIVATIAFPSLLMTGSTIYINTISESKGPVHWHTDIEFWVCGEEIELRDPIGFFSNKIGTSTYHEHNDKRIHLEGVVLEKDYDASLEKFMTVTGGSIDNNSLVIPTEDEIFDTDTDGDSVSGKRDEVREFFTRDSEELALLDMQNGQDCGDEQPAEVQVFQIRMNEDDDTYTQTKLEEPGRYIMKDESIVPPGDCVIVEFDTPKSMTDKLCREYGIRDVERCVEFGVAEFNPDLCKLRFIPTAEQQAAPSSDTMPESMVNEDQKINANTEDTGDEL